MRDYGANDQIGREQTVEEYVAAVVGVMAGVARVLRTDGTAWLNLADTYANRADHGQDRHAGRGHREGVTGPRMDTTSAAPLRSLVLVPQQVALRLQEDGWLIRNWIAWHKPNSMPHWTTGRLQTRWETVLLLTRRPDTRIDTTGWGAGDVWTIPTRPNRSSEDRHPAPFPIDLPERALDMSSQPGDLVLDPFCGSGTTGVAALEAGRRFVGIDTNVQYLDSSARRLGDVRVLSA